MLTFTPRAYTPDDLPALTALVQDAWEPRCPQTVLHIGDLCWRLREPEYERQLRVWEAGRAVVAFGEWAEGQDGCDLNFQVHPVHFNDGTHDRILAWAEGGSLSRPLQTYAAETDTNLIARLERTGYERQQHWTNYHTCSLADAPDVPSLPAGYAVRHLLVGAEEVEARVQGHRSGWQSTKMTVANYQRLMGMPGYRSELDIVVVAPDGSFAATCNCWLDERSGAGLFEPVSTAPAHRRKGLGRVLISFGLRQLWRHGAKTAWVCSVSGNPAATSLYESCGLWVVRRDYDYVRKASGLSI